MALGVSPERVREVRFAEQWRGYRTDEVDDFVEQVAEAFDQLEAQVREASARATEAERRLLERGPDEDLSRTLILAQRTADAAEREAEAEAMRILAAAEERARLLLEEAEGRRARLEEEIDARMASELRDLTERREALERDSASLASFVDGERHRLAVELRGQLAWLERPGHLEPSSPSEAPVPGPFTAALGEIVAGADAPLAMESPVKVSPTGDPELDADEVREGSEVLPGVLVEPGDVLDHDAGRHDPVPEIDDTVLHDGVDALDDVQPEDALSVDVSEDALPEEAVAEPGPSDLSGDDAVLDGLDLPWRTPSEADREDGGHQDGQEDEGLEQVASDVAHDRSATGPDMVTAALDDPFLAELRRAIDDPEPLGPRDDGMESGDWGESRDLYDKQKNSPRFRRRRPR